MIIEEEDFLKKVVGEEDDPYEGRMLEANG